MITLIRLTNKPRIQSSTVSYRAGKLRWKGCSRVASCLSNTLNINGEQTLCLRGSEERWLRVAAGGETGNGECPVVKGSLCLSSTSHFYRLNTWWLEHSFLLQKEIVREFHSTQVSHYQLLLDLKPLFLLPLGCLLEATLVSEHES